jgi:hypothetical protein
LTIHHHLGTVVTAMRLATAFVLGSIVTGVSGCGPVQYITTVSKDASAEVAAAKAASADKYAPYEYTAAVEYLHKAREEEGYADHQAAVRFGKLAIEHAAKAKKIAIANAGQTPETGVPPTDPENENPLDQVKPK